MRRPSAAIPVFAFFAAIVPFKAWAAGPRRSWSRSLGFVNRVGGDRSATRRARLFRIAGRYIAFEATLVDTEVSDTYGEVAVYLANARSGRLYKTATVSNTGPHPQPGQPGPLYRLLALVLNDQGWMGWDARRPRGASAIYSHDSRGNRLRDSAPTHFDHLSLTGNRLTWSLSGNQRSAILH